MVQNPQRKICREKKKQKGTVAWDLFCSFCLHRSIPSGLYFRTSYRKKLKFCLNIPPPPVEQATPKADFPLKEIFPAIWMHTVPKIVWISALKQGQSRLERMQRCTVCRVFTHNALHNTVYVHVTGTEARHLHLYPKNI